uniref:Uncharacterized protein n=1 Tax=Scleropages formosus TaxID=113540 RepID=A0A8C9SHD1_SCLFO
GGHQSKCQNSLVCCLCSRSANAVDLGDLHGPYYPEGYKPAAKAQRSKQGLKEEEYSDSDSSFSARSRRRAQAHTSWPPRPAHRLKREDVLGSSHTLATDSEGLESPSSKRPRTELITDDWYSPPVVPLDTNEYWVHEDCGIWSAGVFLVKGKLYGLEEAVRLAQETVRFNLDFFPCWNHGACLKISLICCAVCFAHLISWAAVCKIISSVGKSFRQERERLGCRHVIL